MFFKFTKLKQLFPSTITLLLFSCGNFGMHTILNDDLHYLVDITSTAEFKGAVFGSIYNYPKGYHVVLNLTDGRNLDSIRTFRVRVSNIERKQKLFLIDLPAGRWALRRIEFYKDSLSSDWNTRFRIAAFKNINAQLSIYRNSALYLGRFEFSDLEKIEDFTRYTSNLYAESKTKIFDRSYIDGPFSVTIIDKIEHDLKKIRNPYNYKINKLGNLGSVLAKSNDSISFIFKREKTLFSDSEIDYSYTLETCEKWPLCLFDDPHPMPMHFPINIP